MGGSVFGKCEVTENKYLQNIRKDFLKPIKRFKDNGFNKVYSMYSKYKNKLKEYNENKGKDENILFELTLYRLELKKEMNAILHYRNTKMLNHVDSYWKSYRNSILAKAEILNTHKMRGQSLDAWHSEDDAINIDLFDDDTKNEFDEDDIKNNINITDIDDKVGFDDYSND